MPGSSELELHAALVAAIKADAGLSALIAGRVYDWPQSDSVYPFVTVGDINAQPWDTDSREGADNSVTVHVWARGVDARAKAREIGVALSALLHRRPASLSVDGHSVITVSREFGLVDRDGQGASEGTSLIAHGIYRYRVVTQAAA